MKWIREVDYLIIGAGIAWLFLKHKLIWESVLIDKNPFWYKIWESHLPNLLHCDEEFLEFVENAKSLKSYCIKRWSVFIDKISQEQSCVAIPLGHQFALHAERWELEKELSEFFKIDVKKESAEEIDFERNIVHTNKHIYKVRKYIIDSSWYSKFSWKLKQNICEYRWFSSFAKWGYWEISNYSKNPDSFSWMTLLTRIDKNTWSWQIPLFNNKVLSCGIIKANEEISDELYDTLVQENKYEGYTIKKVSDKLKGELWREYLQNIFKRSWFAEYIQDPIIHNTILVGDAFCFADPVFSTWTWVAASSAVFLSNLLNSSKFSKDLYREKTKTLLWQVIQWINYWYDMKWKNEETTLYIRDSILQWWALHEYVKSSKLLSLHSKQIAMELTFNKEWKISSLYNGNKKNSIHFKEHYFKYDDESWELILGNILSENASINIKWKKVINLFRSLIWKEITIKKLDILGKTLLKDWIDYKMFSIYIKEIIDKWIFIEF